MLDAYTHNKIVIVSCSTFTFSC